MVIKCQGCWQEQPNCSCGPFNTSPVKDAYFGRVVEITGEVVMKCCGKSAIDCECDGD